MATILDNETLADKLDIGVDTADRMLKIAKVERNRINGEPVTEQDRLDAQMALVQLSRQVG